MPAPSVPVPPRAAPPVTGTVTVNAAAELDPSLIRAVAAGLNVRIGPALADQVQARHDLAAAALRGGAAAYGVTTGMGSLSGVSLSDAEQQAHQRNLLLGRATGGPPWLAADEVRAIFAVRLRTFLSGDSAVSAGLCTRLADFLAAGLVPAVPRGGAGCAGEIIQLAHCFGPVAGVGSVLAGPTADSTAADGPTPASTAPAGAALGAHGLAPYSLAPKEGIALLAGVPGATALSLLAEADARSVQEMLTTAAALSIAAIRAPSDPYLAACARGDDVLAAVLGQIRATGCQPGEPRMLQAPVSFRVAGQVQAQVVRAADGLAAAAERALAGVTDSPAFLDGRFVGTAGFYGIDLAAHCDGLAAAVTHAAEVAAARVHRLLDPRVTGLPAQLARRPGPQAGLVAVHKRAVGEVHAMRRLAMPTAVGLVETSGGQEDVQSFAWEAAVSLRAALAHARAVAACEALTAFQAASLAGPPWPAGCQRQLDRLAELVKPVDEDRPLGPDIELLSGGSWLARPDA
jgi:histidine ammonia-lyase